MEKKLPEEIKMDQESIREILTTQKGSRPFCSRARNIIHEPVEESKDLYQLAIASYVLRPLEDQIASTNIAYCNVGVVGFCNKEFSLSSQARRDFEKFENVPVYIREPEFSDAKTRGYTIIAERIKEKTQEKEESLLLSKFQLLSDFIYIQDSKREIFVFKNNEIVLSTGDQHRIEILDDHEVDNTWLVGIHTSPDFLSFKYLWDSVPDIEQYIKGDKDSIIQSDSRILSHCLWAEERSALFKEENENYKVSFYFKPREDARPNLIDIYVPKRFRESFDGLSYSISETMDEVADKITCILKGGHLTSVGSIPEKMIGGDKMIPMPMRDAYEKLYRETGTKRLEMDAKYEEWGWKRRS